MTDDQNMTAAVREFTDGNMHPCHHSMTEAPCHKLLPCPFARHVADFHKVSAADLCDTVRAMMKICDFTHAIDKATIS